MNHTQNIRKYALGRNDSDHPEFTAADAAAAIPGLTPDSASGKLAYLAQTGELTRTRRGVYRLTTAADHDPWAADRTAWTALAEPADQPPPPNTQEETTPTPPEEPTPPVWFATWTHGNTRIQTIAVRGWHLEAVLNVIQTLNTEPTITRIGDTP